MMALIHNKMAIVPNPVIHHAFSHQALDDGHIQGTIGFLLTPADLANRLGRKSQKG